MYIFLSGLSPRLANLLHSRFIWCCILIGLKGEDWQRIGFCLLAVLVVRVCVFLLLFLLWKYVWTGVIEMQKWQLYCYAATIFYLLNTLIALPKSNTELEFVNVCGAQESIPRNRLAGRYVKKGCHTGPPGWESITGLLKRFPNSGTEFYHPTFWFEPPMLKWFSVTSFFFST